MMWFSWQCRAAECAYVFTATVIWIIFTFNLILLSIFFIRSLYHIIKYHLDDFIASDIWGYLADGRGMINELQENIATNRKFGTHKHTHDMNALSTHTWLQILFSHFHALPMAILEMYVTDDATMQTYWIHPIHMMVGLDSHWHRPQSRLASAL